ncbi:hypothetical protein QBC46DRAFT_377682 [Diplogelasinospora grovesii]|uniref:Uncharacterized protein n=1 Tax=Diplogelasinospora grovesii TaxID=303347 RepID=A0AAN6NE32_9PEZI|nr:hypothetical protein QBC46DRAFT_377682 [Diplogelasinospora grovesii]
MHPRPSWEKPLPAEDAKATVKRIVHGYWSSGKDPRAGEKFASMNAISKTRTPENPEGVRPGQNIEDAERSPLEHLLFGKSGDPAVYRYDYWQTPMQNIQNHRQSRTAAAHTSDALTSSSSAVPEADAEFIIDPITNRRVPKPANEVSYSTSDKDVEIPANSFEPYRSQLAPFQAPKIEDEHAPVFLDGPPPEAELKKYSQVELDDQPWDQDSGTTAANPSGPVSTLINTVGSKHKDVSWHHGDGISGASGSASTGFGTLAAEVNGYNDLDKYKPVLDEVPSALNDTVAPAYEDLGRYGAVKYREPDGKPVEETPGEKYEDLDRYGPIKSYEPDGKYQMNDETPIDPEELRKYQAFRSHEPDGMYAAECANPSPDEAELAKYDAFRSHEPDGMYAAECANPSSDEAELAKYDAFRSHEPDGKYAVRHVEASTDSAELNSYQPVLSHEPDGKYAALNEPGVEKPDLGYHEAFGYEDAETKYSLVESRGGEYQQTGQEMRSETQGEKTHYRKMLGELMSRHAAESDAADMEASSTLRESKEKLTAQTTAQPSEEASGQSTGGEKVTGLTGNYARDFPEEFAKTWRTAGSKPRSTLLPTDVSDTFVQQVQLAEREEIEAAFPHRDGALQPALDRHQKSARSLPEGASSSETDIYSHAPQGLETSYVEERGTETTLPVPAKVYGKTRNDLEVSESSPPAETTVSEPTVYKMLAYDPTMQSVNIAETTSVVPDSSNPLTPAEVVLRLSNPAKFFPHFAPLQAQGFEIVSGSGDVLVFRQVRSAAPEQLEQPVKSSTEPEAKLAATVNPINPIDMTGGNLRDYYVAAGRFASPTGFVNYDLPPPQAPPPKRFVSGIDVRREEPVFSGLRMDEERDPEESAKKPKSLPKRLVVGAAWVAGVSYALGVVGEYFKTGGTDGRGPKGF